MFGFLQNSLVIGWTYIVAGQWLNLAQFVATRLSSEATTNNVKTIVDTKQDITAHVSLSRFSGIVCFFYELCKLFELCWWCCSIFKASLVTLGHKKSYKQKNVKTKSETVNNARQKLPVMITQYWPGKFNLGVDLLGACIKSLVVRFYIFCWSASSMPLVWLWMHYTLNHLLESENGI